MSKSKRKQPTTAQDVFILGGILAVLGLVAIIEGNNIGGVFLLGLGVVFMASTSKEGRKRVRDFFFKRFKKLVSRSD